MCYTAAVTCIYLLIIYNSFTFFSDNRCVYDGRDPFNQNFWKFRSKTQWIGFSPSGKVSKKLVHLLRWVSFHGQTGLNFA